MSCDVRLMLFGVEFFLESVNGYVVFIMSIGFVKWFVVLFSVVWSDVRLLC